MRPAAPRPQQAPSQPSAAPAKASEQLRAARSAHWDANYPSMEPAFNAIMAAIDDMDLDTVPHNQVRGEVVDAIKSSQAEMFRAWDRQEFNPEVGARFLDELYVNPGGTALRPKQNRVLQPLVRRLADQFRAINQQTPNQ